MAFGHPVIILKGKRRTFTWLYRGKLDMISACNVHLKLRPIGTQKKRHDMKSHLQLNVKRYFEEKNLNDKLLAKSSSNNN